MRTPSCQLEWFRDQHEHCLGWQHCTDREPPEDLMSVLLTFSYSAGHVGGQSGPEPFWEPL
jgi:hypothetical protein